MSLGSRAYHGSRPFASSHLTAPRDCLWFLYPRWFAPAATPAQHAAARSEPNPNDRGSANSARSEQEMPDYRQSYELSTPSKPRAPTNHDAAHDPATTLLLKQSRKKENFKLATSTVMAASRSLSLTGMNTLEDTLKGRSGQKPLSGFVLGPATIRRVQRSAEKELIDKERRDEVARARRAKDTWSYDWRIPLADLKQHYKPGVKKEDSSGIVRPYFLGRAPKYRETRAQDIPHPLVWSPLSFAAHVEDLTQSRVSKVMHRHVYTGTEIHITAVRDCLLSMFNDLALRHAVTAQAFDIAIEFLCKHEFIPSVRTLFRLMDDLGVNLHPETFNILLRSAARRKDLHVFTYLLRTMVGRGINPDRGTWLAFLSTVKSKAVRLHVARHMRALGMVERPSEVRSVIDELFDLEIDSHLRKGQGLGSFVRHLDSKFGPVWLSITTANQICYELGNMVRMVDAMKMLHIMSDRGCKPNHNTLHVFLGHCLKINRLEQAAEVLRTFRDDYNVEPGRYHLSSLFRLAWNTRSYNTGRVIWRVLCLHAAVPFHIQATVLHSLTCNTPEDPKTFDEIWQRSAGKVLVGVDFAAKEGTDPLPSEDAIMRQLTPWSQTGDRRRRLRRLAYRVLRRDLDASMHYRLAEDFVDLFLRAVAADRVWVREQRLVNEPTSQKLRDAIGVRIIGKRPTPEALTAKSWKLRRLHSRTLHGRKHAWSLRGTADGVTAEPSAEDASDAGCSPCSGEDVPPVCTVADGS